MFADTAHHHQGDAEDERSPEMLQLMERLNEGDYRQVVDMAKAIVSSAASPQTDVFEALCVQLTIHVAQEVSLDEVRKVRKQFNIPFDNQQEAMLHYIEGTAALAKFPDSAHTLFDKALREDPHMVLAHLGLGAVHFKNKDWRKSFGEYKIVLERLGSLAPPITRVALGMCCFFLDKIDHGIKCVERALEVNPDDWVAMMVLFVFSLKKRNIARASEMMQRLYKNHPSAIIVQRFADVVFFRAIHEDRIHEKAAVLRSLIETARTAAEEMGVKGRHLVGYSNLQLGRLHHAQGNLREAREYYERACSKEEGVPSLLAPRVHLAKVIFHLDGPTAALKSVVQSLEIAKNERLPNEKALSSMASALYAMEGLHESAIKTAQHLIDSAAAADPTSWSIAAWANRLVPEQYTKHAETALRLREEIGMKPDRSIVLNLAALEGKDALVKAVKEHIDGLDLTDVNILESEPRLRNENRMVPVLFNYALHCEDSEPDVAEKFYQHLTVHFPHDANAFYRLALLWSKSDRKAPAMRLLVAHLRIRPDDDRTYSLLASIIYSHYNHDNTQDALNVRTHAATNQLLRKPQSKRVTLAICIGILRIDELQRSRDPRTRSNLVQSALDKFRYALRHDKGNVLAAHGAAVCVALKKDTVQATVLFERVAEAQCNGDTAQRGITSHVFNSLVLTKAYRKAVAEITAAKNNFTPMELCAIACCHAVIQEYDEAVQVIAKARSGLGQDNGRNVRRTLIDYNFALIHLLSVLYETSRLEYLPVERATELLKRIDTAGAAISSLAARNARGIYSEHTRSYHDAAVELYKQISKLRVKEIIRELSVRSIKERKHFESLDEMWRDQASQFQRSMVEEEDLRKQQEEERINIKRQRTEGILERMRTAQTKLSQTDGFEQYIHGENVDDEVDVPMEDYENAQFELQQRAAALGESIGEDLVDGIDAVAEEEYGAEPIAPHVDAATMLAAFGDVGAAELDPTLNINATMVDPATTTVDESPTANKGDDDEDALLLPETQPEGQ